ncbi:lactate utilization protein [Clostridium sp.]|uniref:lactate utilization protein n=1 Tax=Clostridium sp. TaxID=1506 RepID=UPI0026DB37A8|nr:lactate utilization protein [Clostridium sp.]MDO5040020.1 lactate utilization protein [Clostridium sp.]
MDKNVIWANEQKITRTVQAINKNNMNGYYAKDREELIRIIEDIVSENSLVSCGGSMTLLETGVMEHLRSGRYKFLDRYKEDITREEVVNMFKESFFADAYFTSSNAVTENGELYNVDGNGNRVAAMLYGPEKVIVICGVNKIVKNVEEAIKRNRECAAPINAKRLNKETPCSKVGYCMDCKSKDRICNEYTLIKRQNRKERMHIIFLNENLGY